MAIDRRPTTHRPAFKPRALAAPAALAGVLLLAACGGSSSDSPPQSAEATRANAALDFSKCMRQHGIKNFPNPEFSEGHAQLRVHAGAGGIEASPQLMEAAQNACKRYREALAPKLTPQERVQREEALQKFAACMRQHGIHIETSAGGAGIRIRHKSEGGPNPESANFQAAQEACQKLLPGGGPKGKLRLPRPPANRNPGGPGHEEQSLSIAGG